MNKRIEVQLVFRILVLLTFTFCGCSCAPRNLQGNIAGQVVSASGQGVSGVSVTLINVVTGNSVQQQNTGNAGHFFLRSIPGGTYTIKLNSASGAKIRADVHKIKLDPGRTKTVIVTVL